MRSWYHLAFCLFNFSFAFTFSGILGSSKLEAVVSKVLVRLDINLCTGLLSMNSVGVLRWSNRVNHGSLSVVFESFSEQRLDNFHSRLCLSVGFVMMW